jgi:aspartate kinase
MKFGGTSLAPRPRVARALVQETLEQGAPSAYELHLALTRTLERATVARFAEVARHIASVVKRGCRAVVVVSAIGNTTDDLITLAEDVTSQPDRRELDMLVATGEQTSAALMAITLNALQCPALSLTGGQAGILAEAVPGRAHIRSVQPDRIRKELASGKTVVVAGFQGITEQDAAADLTTLGRGGSDASAAALAVALGAECHIYTDVNGVYTADPRIVPTAKLLPRMCCDEMLELASHGAKVLQARAVEIAARAHIQLRVRSSFELGDPGTVIGSAEEMLMEEQPAIRGLACEKGVGMIAIRKIANKPGIAAAVFKALDEASINVDIIVQPGEVEEPVDISFSVSGPDLQRAYEKVKAVSRKLGAAKVERIGGLAKVSVVGIGLHTRPGLAHKVFLTLAEADINIVAITTSEIRITCVVEERCADQAVQLLHQAFGLQH